MRARAKLTQTQLAKAVGRKKNSAVAWEAGDSVPEPEVFPKLAAQLGIPVDVLMQLAGVTVDEPWSVNSTLAKLADDAEALGRQLRALSTLPTEGRVVHDAKVEGSLPPDDATPNQGKSRAV